MMLARVFAVGRHPREGIATLIWQVCQRAPSSLDVLLTSVAAWWSNANSWKHLRPVNRPFLGPRPGIVRREGARLPNVR
jgi:hypothetical protein